MRICIIGERSIILDEGMRNIACRFVEVLSRRHEILHLDLKDVISLSKFWKPLRKFNPNIIHYVPGPSIMSFIIGKLCVSYSLNSPKLILSSFHPVNFSKISLRLLSNLTPDLLLVQSEDTEKMFLQNNYQTRFLPIGVDLKKFRPVSDSVKKELREKYGIDRNKFVVLHVGHIKSRRNIEALIPIQGDGTQVVIIGSTSTKIEPLLYRKLSDSGCIILSNYMKNIEEVYALSDIYVFPTYDRLHSVETPLSVLEAMACNLPVITTKFGALPRIFDEGGGLTFIRGDNLIGSLDLMKGNLKAIRTRDKVEQYSWEASVEQLEQIYIELLNRES